MSPFTSPLLLQFFFQTGGGLRYKYVNVCLPPIHRKGTGTLSVAEHAVVWCKGLVRSWRRGGELRKRSRGRSGEGCGGDKGVGVRRIHY